MSAKPKSSIDKRLARIEGQVRGIRRMVEERAYCVDILTQLAAVKSALDQVGAELATEHVRTCMIGHGTGSEHDSCKKMSPEEMVEELRVTLSRLLK